VEIKTGQKSQAANDLGECKDCVAAIVMQRFSDSTSIITEVFGFPPGPPSVTYGSLTD
jgi:hypothetical protein